MAAIFSLNGDVDASASELGRIVASFQAVDGRSGLSRSQCGEWLVQFQNTKGSWDVCAKILRAGPTPDAEGQYLQAFCAQTLAVHARVLMSRYPRVSHRSYRDSLEALLALHLPPAGRPAVWRQLALALVSADIWLASWLPLAVLSALALPLAVRWELLILPTELLFCDRALPLSDIDLWHAAAATLWEACPGVFAFLLQEGSSSILAESTRQQPMQVLAVWLRGARMSFQWLTGRERDEAAPIRSLFTHWDVFLAMSLKAPEEACEVAQQLARWRLCDDVVLPLLRPLLENLFKATFDRPRHEVLLPLLCDLAYDRWPRATLGDIELDWQTISLQALSALRESMMVTISKLGDGVWKSDDDYNGAGEECLAVWQALATTLRDGTREWHDESDYDGPHAEWYKKHEVLVQVSAIPQLFSLLARELLDLLRAPSAPTAAQLKALWEIRSGAQSTLSSWARLVGNSPAWQDALWAPLRNVGQRLALVSQNNALMEESLLSETEVVLWFSATLAASWPESAGAVPVAIAVYEFGPVLDAAPSPWRSLLWSSACTLASTAPAEHCPRLLEWMLQRSPQQSAEGIVELLELTELPFAQAVEYAGRQLPNDTTANIAAAERIANLALADVNASCLHQHSSKARAVLLGAMRHTMGSDVSPLCQGLSGRILPILANVAATEAKATIQPTWHAAQTLFAALAAVLPRRAGDCKAAGAGDVVSDVQHPIVLLWREYWPCLESALLPKWRPLSVSDEPLASATEVLVLLSISVPVLLADALALLAQSAEQHALPDLQISAVCDIALKIKCPPLDSSHAAQLLLDAICRISKSVLSRAKDMLESPSTIANLFRLLVAALGSGRRALCNGQLRPLLLGQVTLMGRCIGILNEMLPDCTSPVASQKMFSFVVCLLSGNEISNPSYRDALVGLLPGICGSVCRALASQEHLACAEGVVDAADILYRSAEAFPDALPGALAIGLRHVAVPEWSREQLQQHVERRAEWPKRWEWTTQLQQIVSEWQSELRLASTKLAT